MRRRSSARTPGGFATAALRAYGAQAGAQSVTLTTMKPNPTGVALNCKDGADYACLHYKGSKFATVTGVSAKKTN